MCVLALQSYFSSVPEAVVIALLVAFPLLGALARRWALLVLPLVGWPLLYAGLDAGWWLYGTGDGWETAAAFLTVVGAATTALAIGAARRLERMRAVPGSPGPTTHSRRAA